MIERGVGISRSINLAAQATLRILFLGSHEIGESTDRIVIQNLPAFLKSSDRWNWLSLYFFAARPLTESFCLRRGLLTAAREATFGPCKGSKRIWPHNSLFSLLDANRERPLRGSRHPRRQRVRHVKRCRPIHRLKRLRSWIGYLTTRPSKTWSIPLQNGRQIPRILRGFLPVAGPAPEIIRFRRNLDTDNGSRHCASSARGIGQAANAAPGGDGELVIAFRLGKKLGDRDL